MITEKKQEKGSVTIEATVCVTLFMVFSLFLVTLFYSVSVQEAISHSLVQTADHLSLEAYSISKLQTDVNTGLKSALTDLWVKLFSTSGSDEHFFSDQRWFSEDQLLDTYVEHPEESTLDPNLRTIDLAVILKQRFVGYFANGDEEYADFYLKKMGVENGLNGLDFSESQVKSGKLYIKVKYTIKYLINIGNLGKVNAEQSYCSKIWK